jgi:hypothetical protein
MDIFENTVPKAMQGGISIRAPFVKDEYGLSRVVSIGKGGTLSKATGVAAVADKVSEVKGAIRFGDNRVSEAINATISALGGRDGKAYAKAMQNLYKADPALGGFYEYNALRAATKNNAKRLTQFRANAGSAVGVLHDFAYKKDAPAEAKELVKRYFLNRQALDAAQDATLTEAQRDLDDQARGIARKIITVFDDFADEAREVFGDGFTDLDDYVPLMFSKEAKDALKENIPLESLARGGREWRAPKSRTKFSTLEADENGKLVRRWLTPAEANERLRTLAVSRGEQFDDVFETDPMELLVNYSEGMARVLSQRRLVQELMDRGVLTKAVTRVTQTPNVERALTAARSLDESQLANFSVDDFTNRFLTVLDASDPNDVKLVGDMVNTIIDLQTKRLSDAEQLAGSVTGKQQMSLP